MVGKFFCPAVIHDLRFEPDSSKTLSFELEQITFTRLTFETTKLAEEAIKK